MKIINSIHVTATERKQLKVFLESGMSHAKVNRKYYTIMKGALFGGKWELEIRIATPSRKDNGEKYLDCQTITVIK